MSFIYFLAFMAVTPCLTRGDGAVITPPNEWYAYKGITSAPGGVLLKELTDQSIALLRQRAANVSTLTEKAEWISRINVAKLALDNVFAPLPPTNRTPPTFIVTQTLTRSTHTVELIRYQTRPGFWATGAIWTPAHVKASAGNITAPGVLLVSGHTPDGFRSNNRGGPVIDNAPADDDYQVVQINLVLRGFVVLAFDPIGQGERMQYADIPIGAPDPTAPWSKSAEFLGGSTHDHEFMGRQLLLNGIGLMSFWLHDETVSLDLLESLPTVNKDNLGVAGCSGGGTQTSYIAAMDSRIKAASMACYMSTFEVDRLWTEGGGSDGEQTWPRGIIRGLDKPDLIEVRADKSTQVLVTTGDTCFPAAGGWAAIAEAAPAYTALGGRLETYTAVWHHGWVLPTREQINKYFCAVLAEGFGSGGVPTACKDPTEIDVSKNNPDATEWIDAELQITKSGQVVTSAECISAGQNIAVTVHNFTAEITKNNMAAIKMKQENDPVAFLAQVRSNASKVCGFLAPIGPVTSRIVGAQFATPHTPDCPKNRTVPGCPPVSKNDHTNDQTDDQASDQARVASSIGLIEQYMVFGEGSCFATVSIFFPTNITDMVSPRGVVPTIAWYRKDTGLSNSDGVAVLTAAGYAVAMVEVCGVGSSGDAFSFGPASDRGLTKGQSAPDLAHEIGRSIPGFQAGDFVRAHKFLSARNDVNLVATVTNDHLDVAALHAALSSPSDFPKHLAMIAPSASLAMSAQQRLYDPTTYYSWIVGLLNFYDLTDAVAAITTATTTTTATSSSTSTPTTTTTTVLILSPVDEILVPLSDTAIASTYEFARKMGKGNLKIQGGGTVPDEETAAKTILVWLQSNTHNM